MDPLSPYGRALLDYFQGDTDATLTVHTDLGEHDAMPVALFFRTPDNFFPFEQAALALCRGVVLDVGAGAGVHTLYLQDQGFDVRAIEVVPEAIEIMRKRGVRKLIQSDIFEIETEPVDTVLMMMNGPGPAGTIRGLKELLIKLRTLLKPGGQILLDSASPRRRSSQDEAPELEWPERMSDYLGEAWVRLEYKEQIGPPFQELYVDYRTMVDRAAPAGLAWDRVFSGNEESYVARLVRK